MTFTLFSNLGHMKLELVLISVKINTNGQILETKRHRQKTSKYVAQNQIFLHNTTQTLLKIQLHY